MRSDAKPADDPEAGGAPGPSAVDWVRRTDQVDTFLGTLDRHLRRRRRRWRQAGAVAVLLALGGVFWNMRPVAPSSAPTAITARGAIVRQVLSDGSEVDLGDGTDLSVAFGPQGRRIALERGMAHFQVAKSPVPFVVAAGRVEVRAVGTAFATTLGASGDVEVIVTEGTVAIDRPAGEGSAAAPAPGTIERQPANPAGPVRTARTAAVMRAGDRLVITAGTPWEALERQIAPLGPEEISRRLGWRVPQLRFEGTPLAEAVPLFNRHSKIQLRLADEATGSVKVSGTLRGDNVIPLVRLLELEHGVHADRQGDVITLRRASAPVR